MTETATVTLTRPLGDVTKITLRKPSVGALRGLQMTQIQMQDVNTLARLLPRITTPALTEDQVYELDLVDFTALSLAVLGFLVPGAMPATGSD